MQTPARLAGLNPYRKASVSGGFSRRRIRERIDRLTSGIQTVGYATRLIDASKVYEAVNSI